jgi:hypothetical protein
MTAAHHPAASHHLPSFITAPGETDVLMVGMAVFLAGTVLMFGILYFRLHSLPEHIAHRSHKLQYEIVAVLGLISLFTHMHIFWIAGLLLALIDLPDFGGMLGRIAGSVERIADKPGETHATVAGMARAEGAAESAHEPVAATRPAEVKAEAPQESLKRGDGRTTVPPVPELVPASTRS